MTYTRWMIVAGVCLWAALALTGCFGNADMVRAMKENNATFCAKVVTPWGQATYLQANPEQGTVNCDGMTLTYGNSLGVAGGRR